MNMKMILLAEDDMDDRTIFDEIFSDISNGNMLLSSVENGQEVIETLHAAGKDHELPALIILDQNMPRMTGKEALVYIRENRRYDNIPVVIYSTYYDQRFEDECTGIGADLVVLKPDSLDKYRKMVTMLIDGYLLNTPALKSR